MKKTRFYRQLVFESPYSVWACCLLTLVFNISLFGFTDTLDANPEDLWANSRAQLLGMLMLIVLLPSWLVGCFFVTQRHTRLLARQLDKLAAEGLGITDQILHFPVPQAVTGLLAGLAYALFANIPTGMLDRVMAGDSAATAIFIGQIEIWMCVGFLLAIRLWVVNLFYQLGEVVRLSVFEQSLLQPFARVGLLDVVIVVGGLAISTVQSLDAQFRLANYLTAFIVAVPAAVALLMRPMWAVHRRLRDRKSQLMQEVTARLAHMPEAGDAPAMAELETLLQRRDRIRALSTWPLDVETWSRLIFYTLIPPIAWAGSALMEVLVSRFVNF